MSKELYITRRKFWADKDGPEITYFDWLDYLNIDPSLQMDAQFEAGREIARPEDEGPAHVVWTEWPSRKDGKEARFWLAEGNIMTSDGDADIRRKMFVMADVLSGQLQGAKGEVYDSLGNIEAGRRKRSRGGNRPWWKFW